MSTTEDNSLSSDSQQTKQSSDVEAEMSVTEYKQWVDSLLLNSESLQKARQHSPGKIYHRTEKKVT